MARPKSDEPPGWERRSLSIDANVYEMAMRHAGQLGFRSFSAYVSMVLGKYLAGDIASVPPFYRTEEEQSKARLDFVAGKSAHYVPPLTDPPQSARQKEMEQIERDRAWIAEIANDVIENRLAEMFAKAQTHKPTVGSLMRDVERIEKPNRRKKKKRKGDDAKDSAA